MSSETKRRIVEALSGLIGEKATDNALNTACWLLIRNGLEPEYVRFSFGEPEDGGRMTIRVKLLHDPNEYLFGAVTETL